MLVMSTSATSRKRPLYLTARTSQQLARLGDRTPGAKRSKRQSSSATSAAVSLAAPSPSPSPSPSPLPSRSTSHSPPLVASGIHSRFARQLAWAGTVETVRHVSAGVQVSLPLALVARVAFGALTQADIRAALTDDACALAKAASEAHQSLGAQQQTLGSPSPLRLSRLESLPDAVLGEVYSYVNTEDVFAAVRRTSRRLWVRVFTPGGVSNLNFSHHAGIGAAPSFRLEMQEALETVPCERWNCLATLCAHELRLKDMAGANQFATALGCLGPRLRVLHLPPDCDNFIGLHRVPATVWPALRELRVTFVSEEEEEEEKRKNKWAPGPAVFVGLERLAVDANSWSLRMHVRCSRFLTAAVVGRLRALTLTVKFWEMRERSGEPAQTHSAVANAVAAHAPFLESLHLTVGAVLYYDLGATLDDEIVRLPSFPNAHTLVFDAPSNIRFALAAAPHPKLATLRLQHRAQLDIGGSADAGESKTCESKTREGDWRAGALRVLQTSRPSTDRARAALTARGGCGPLDVLSVRECVIRMEGDRYLPRGAAERPADHRERRRADIRGALAFAEALAKPSVRKLQFDFGGHFGGLPKRKGGPQHLPKPQRLPRLPHRHLLLPQGRHPDSDAQPTAGRGGEASGEDERPSGLPDEDEDAAGIDVFLAELLAWPNLRGLWVGSQCVPQLRWWSRRQLSPGLESICFYEKLSKRPHALTANVQWPTHQRPLFDCEEFERRMAHTGGCAGQWPPTCR